MTEDLKKYSLEEVSKHDGSNGSRIWIVVKDKVLDVTDYLDEHPGGGELITEYAGKDSTKEYDDAGHSAEADRYLKKITIGELIEEDKRANRKKKIVPVDNSTEQNSPERSIFAMICCGICA